MALFETIFQTCYFIYSFLKRTKFLTPCGLSYSVRHFSSHDHHPAPFPTPVAPPPPPPPVFRTTGQGCPVIPPKTPYECTGQASTCWSPGVRDTDCPGHGLCCFNGCANKCLKPTKCVEKNQKVCKIVTKPVCQEVEVCFLNTVNYHLQSYRIPFGFILVGQIGQGQITLGYQSTIICS